MSPVLSIVLNVLFVLVGLMVMFAVLRVPAILAEAKKQTALLQKILKAVETADANRREEFEAMDESAEG